jgi:hypothetical protein
VKFLIFYKDPSPVILNNDANNTNNSTNNTLNSINLYGNHFGSRGCYTLKYGVKVAEFGIKVKQVDAQKCIITCDYFNFTYTMVAK